MYQNKGLTGLHCFYTMDNHKEILYPDGSTFNKTAGISVSRMSH